MSVCKNRFELFARIFSRRHEQTTFSAAGFLGVLKVSNGKYSVYPKYLARANSADPDQMPPDLGLLYLPLIQEFSNTSAGGKLPALVAQLDMCLASDQEVVGQPPPGRQHSFIEIDHEIFSTVFHNTG